MPAALCVPGIEAAERAQGRQTLLVLVDDSVLGPRAAWALALGLLCAGVAGNLIDRFARQPGVLRGHVVDFLQLPHWPIFNVADMCISAAAVLIMVLAVVKNVGIDGERYGRGSAPSEPVAAAPATPASSGAADERLPREADDA